MLRSVGCRRVKVAAGLILAVILAATVGCGAPSEKRVRAEFVQRHPGSEVLSIEVGEGDFKNAYFHIRYLKPQDSQTYQQVWLYQDLGDGKEWTCTHRASEGTVRQGATQ